MRNNGLPGNDYVAVADVDPQLADALLELLRDAGVPAYADAATPHRGVYNEVRLPDRPTDRLFVQRDLLPVARELLDERLASLKADFDAAAVPLADEPRNGPAVDEAAWAELMAAFSGPSYEGRGPEVGDAGGSGGHEGRELEGYLHEAAAELPRGPREESPPPVEDHFEPPAPPPLGRLEPLTALAWLGVLGAPIFFALALWTGTNVDGWLGLAGVGAFIGGFGVLFSRLGPDRDDDGGDGAVL